jgi:ubiquinone/menaquinone biosynthesis C-methylase UbiE
MPGDDLDALVAEQIAYYRARAREYDDTAPLDTDSRADLTAALDAFAPGGRVLELACGTGQWTVELAKHAAQLTAIDSSSEMIALNRSRVARASVRYVQADVFDWSPPERYDVVFFSAWLSHVPPQSFDDFWTMVGRCLNEHGRVFVIDELPAAATIEQAIPDQSAPIVERHLSSGERFRTVKVFYEPAVLEHKLAGLGWQIEVRTVGWRFFYATGSRRSVDPPSRHV